MQKRFSLWSDINADYEKNLNISCIYFYLPQNINFLFIFLIIPKNDVITIISNI